MARVNWVICPKCQFRYYIGPQLLAVEGMHTLCPRCHHEFDPKTHLEKRMRQSGHYTGSSPLTRDYLIDLLYENIDNLNIDAACKEVAPFINNTNSLDIWSKDFFKAAAQQIDMI